MMLSSESELISSHFRLGSVTSSLSTSSSSKPTVSSAPSISSAPTLREPPTSSSRQPTASDPYPGFTQLPSGEWVAKDQETYELALKWQAEQQAQSELPRGFEEKEIENKGGYKDVDEAKRAKDAWATRPSQVPGQEEEFKKSAQIKGVRFLFSHSLAPLREIELSDFLFVREDRFRNKHHNKREGKVNCLLLSRKLMIIERNWRRGSRRRG